MTSVNYTEYSGIKLFVEKKWRTVGTEGSDTTTTYKVNTITKTDTRFCIMMIGFKKLSILFGITWPTQYANSTQSSSGIHLKKNS